jgi:hypothetical protein
MQTLQERLLEDRTQEELGDTAFFQPHLRAWAAALGDTTDWQLRFARLFPDESKDTFDKGTLDEYDAVSGVAVAVVQVASLGRLRDIINPHYVGLFNKGSPARPARITAQTVGVPAGLDARILFLKFPPGTHVQYFGIDNSEVLRLAETKQLPAPAKDYPLAVVAGRLVQTSSTRARDVGIPCQGQAAEICDYLSRMFSLTGGRVTGVNCRLAQDGSESHSSVEAITSIVRAKLGEPVACNLSFTQVLALPYGAPIMMDAVGTKT